MILEDVQRQFAKTVAPLEIIERPERVVPLWARSRSSNATIERATRLNESFTINATHGKRGTDEHFILRIGPQTLVSWEFVVPQAKPDIKHLLLMAKPMNKGDVAERFLCGHDERHLFVAGVNGAPATIRDAMESLKPTDAKLSQDEHGVRSLERNDRHNDGFLRQGEWFFIPQPDFEPPRNLILKGERLHRNARSKPHQVDELFRMPGETRYLMSVGTDLSRDEYNALSPEKKKELRRQETAVARAYVRGAVRHSDHKTIHLSCWHLVVTSRESMKSIVFFD